MPARPPEGSTSLGIAAESVTGIVVTHEHGDHTRGVGVFSRRFGTPIHLTHPTGEACARLLNGKEPLRFYQPGRPFEVGTLRVEPFMTVHDAADPVAVTVTCPRSGRTGGNRDGSGASHGGDPPLAVRL